MASTIARALAGPIAIRLGADGEAYDGIRKDAVHVAGRLTAADARGPFGNPTSDSARAMVTAATVDALIVVYAPVGDRGPRGAPGARSHRRAGRGGGRRPRGRPVGGVMARPFVSAILAAGGLGTRAGGGVPKQFRPLGRPDAARAQPGGAGPAPACARSGRRAARGASRSGCRPVSRPPGPVRCRRWKAVRGVAIRWPGRWPASSAEAGIVLVHDAARPFVSAA